MISERLKAEREALGLSQQALADRLGISLRSQQNYEKGDRNPDSAYLAALAAARADVLYILTGQRSQPLPATNVIDDRTRLASAIEVVEAGLAETKRRLPPKKKAELVMAAYDLLAQAGRSRDNVIQLVRLAA